MFSFFDFLWFSFILLAPMLLLGLFLSGVIHVFISREAILRWLRDDSLKSVSTSAAVGVPMPLCSCSVVPVVAEMRRKGASRSACMSFLITAPETGADSILVTNAFFGPVVAIARPVISFITAVVAGIFCIGSIRDDSDEKGTAGHECHEHDDDHSCHAHHDHDHGTHEPMVPGQDNCYISLSQFRDTFVNWFRKISKMFSEKRIVSWVKPEFYRDMLSGDENSEKPVSGPPDEAATADNQNLDFKRITKHILHYGFVDIADDILFSLLVGIFLGALLFLIIPGDLASNEYTRWAAYPVMVLLGVPLYICASASTPIAAALVAKGFSPGAALVFLMTGPATNTATIAIIAGQFGSRFTSIYVGSVIVVTVLIGIATDMLLLAIGMTIPVTLQVSSSPTILFLQWTSAIALFALIVWRFRAGAMKSGYEDIMSNLRPLAKHFRRFWRWSAGEGGLGSSRGIGMLCVVALALLLSSGFTTVHPGTVGYGRLFGQVYWKDLEPGLHYLAPWPFVKVDKWPVREVKSIAATSGEEYMSGDLNLFSLDLDVQYRVKDPYVYHYGVTNAESVIENFVKEEIRDFASSREMDQLFNVERKPLEETISGLFEGKRRFAADSAVFDSVELIKVNLLSVAPLPETFGAFREVSNAQDDKERTIVNSHRFLVAVASQVHGNAYYEVKQAEGKAYSKEKIAAAEASAIRRVAEAVRSAPTVLRNMLWREKLETALSDKPKIIVPDEEVLDRVALWKKKPSESGAEGPQYHNPERKEE